MPLDRLRYQIVRRGRPMSRCGERRGATTRGPSSDVLEDLISAKHDGPTLTHKNTRVARMHTLTNVTYLPRKLVGHRETPSPLNASRGRLMLNQLTRGEPPTCRQSLSHSLVLARSFVPARQTEREPGSFVGLGHFGGSGPASVLCSRCIGGSVRRVGWTHTPAADPSVHRSYPLPSAHVHACAGGVFMITIRLPPAGPSS